MSQKTIILIIVLFAILVVGMFVYAFLKQSEIESQIITTPESQMPADALLYPNITRVDAKHFINGDVHTLAGEINLPTPCDLLQAQAVATESVPTEVTVAFTVINNADMCAQVVTAQRFKVETSATSDVTFLATFMGRDIILNLIPAAEGETPDDFELFIKG